MTSMTNPASPQSPGSNGSENSSTSFPRSNDTSSSGSSSVGRRSSKQPEKLGWVRSVPGSFETLASTSSVSFCCATTKWGTCIQPSWTGSEIGFCRSHQTWTSKGRRPDPFYEEKIVKGLLTPTWEYMSDAEAHATVNGRYRGDGRRIDQYVSDDPLGIDEEAV